MAAAEAQQGHAVHLTGQEDNYEGLIVDPQTLPGTTEEFKALLPDALQVSQAAVCWR